MKSLFSNCSVIDGLGNPRLDNMDVWIEGSHIARVTPHASRTVDSPNLDDVAVYDGAGMTLMPGLIDAHVHITYGEALGQEAQDIYTSVESRTLRAAWNVQKVLANGVTGMSEAGGSYYIGVAIRDAIRAGKVKGPRGWTAGRYITTSNGLVEFYPEPASLSVMDRIGGGIGVRCNTLDEMIDEVRRQVRHGVDFIKLADSSYGEHQAFQEEELQTLADLTHQLNRKITIHARGDREMYAAAKAGFDWVQHGNYMAPETVGLLAEKQITLVPTLVLLHNWSQYSDLLGTPEPISRATGRMLERSRKAMAMAHEAGVPIALGTDTGFAMTPYGEFHAKELELLMDYCGMTELEAIRAGTSNGAITIGLDGQTGIVAEGKLADLLLVKGDPSTDITLLQDPKNLAVIMLDGRVVKLDPHIDSWPNDNPRRFVDRRFTRSMLEESGAG